MTSVTPSPAPRTPRPPRAGRFAAAVSGLLIGLLALVLLAAGGTLLWADGKQDADGYLSTGTHRFAASSYAIASDTLDVDLGGVGEVVDRTRFGTVRLQATPRDGERLFVGIARTTDVSRYLARTAHATVTDVDDDPFRATYRAERGTRAPTPPAERRFWAASATGPGTQTVEWDVQDGSWSVVVMNADGSRGVDADLRAGAHLGFLTPVAWGTLGGGLLLLLTSFGLIVAAASRRERP